MKEDCIFCKLANGVFPTHTLYEDDTFRVIFDISPATKGHALIITKEHFDNIYEVSDEVASKALVLAKKVACAMKETLHTDGFNIVQNNGEVAGQTVFHFHIHLIPRYAGDNAIKLWKPGKSTDEELEQIKVIIKSKL